MLIRPICSVPGLPSCAGSCVSTDFGGCGSFNVTCICSNGPLIANLACCVSKVCSAADQESMFAPSQDLMDKTSESCTDTILQPLFSLQMPSVRVMASPICLPLPPVHQALNPPLQARPQPPLPYPSRELLLPPYHLLRLPLRETRPRPAPRPAPNRPLC